MQNNKSEELKLLMSFIGGTLSGVEMEKAKLLLKRCDISRESVGLIQLAISEYGASIKGLNDFISKNQIKDILTLATNIFK